MTTTHRLPVLWAGAALALAACAASSDPHLVQHRTEEAFRPRVDAPRDRAVDVFVTADLDACVDYALAHSSRLRAAFEEWRAQSERAPQVSSLPEPRLTYGEFLEEVETRTGPQERRFGISQAFPWPGELGARARVADLEAAASWERVELARLGVALDVEIAFYDYAYLGRELAIRGELLALLRGLEPVVQARVRAGGGQEDLLRLQVEVGRVEDDLASAERRRPVASARLAAAMQLEPGERGLPLPALDLPVPIPVDTAGLALRVQDASPAMARLLAEVDARRGAEDLTAFRRRPRFSVGVDTISTGSAVVDGTPGSGDDPWLVGLSMTLPVWGGSYAAAEREARHRTRAANERLDAARVELVAEALELAYAVDDAGRRIALYGDSLIPRATEALELVAASYRTGTATVLDLIDSERALLELELARWRACRDYLQGRARLVALLGGELP